MRVRSCSLHNCSQLSPEVGHRRSSRGPFLSSAPSATKTLPSVKSRLGFRARASSMKSACKIGGREEGSFAFCINKDSLAFQLVYVLRARIGVRER